MEDFLVEIITKSELREFSSKISVNEQHQLRKRATTASVGSSTFLSHSSKDDDLINGCIIVLENHGASVYVDEKDPEMPPFTNTGTAELLKKRIGQCRRFVMLATQNSKESKWVPWELGIADGSKGFPPVAVFPASESKVQTNWTEQEYIGLYQKIVWGTIKGEEKARWLVWNSKKNTAVPLAKWLKEI
jgi:hypothetical protein